MKNSTSTIDQLLEQKQIVCKADILVWNVMDPICQFEIFFYETQHNLGKLMLLKGIKLNYSYFLG